MYFYGFKFNNLINPLPQKNRFWDDLTKLFNNCPKYRPFVDHVFSEKHTFCWKQKLRYLGGNKFAMETQNPLWTICSCGKMEKWFLVKKSGVWRVKTDENEKKLWKPHKERINIRSFLYGWFGLRSHLRSIFSKNVQSWENLDPKILGNSWNLI